MDLNVTGLASNPIATGAAGLVLGAGAAAGVAAIASSSKKSKKRKSKSVRKRSSKSRRARYQKKPYTAGKRKDTSHRRIRYTKNNQPYIILASGKARFIKKSIVRSARKRKGGKY